MVLNDDGSSPFPGNSQIVSHSCEEKKSGSGQGLRESVRYEARRLHHSLTATVDPFLPTPLVRMM